jgi:hypothetical protein
MAASLTVNPILRPAKSGILNKQIAVVAMSTKPIIDFLFCLNIVFEARMSIGSKFSLTVT